MKVKKDTLRNPTPCWSAIDSQYKTGSHTDRLYDRYAKILDNASIDYASTYDGSLLKIVVSLNDRDAALCALAK